MRFFSPFTPLLKGWLLSFALFGLVAFLMAGQFMQMSGQPWDAAARMAVRDWGAWVLLAPLIFRLGMRWPIERERWRFSAPVHVLSAFLALAFCAWWADWLWRPLPPEGPKLEERAPGFPRKERPPGPPRFGGPPSASQSLLFSLGFRLPIYLAIISAAHAIFFYRRSVERDRRALGLEASLAKARLAALSMQLQPHFLFNSLNAIAELVHRDADAADAMIVSLSDLLRLTLETSGEDELPLKRELQFVERYLAIEQMRLGDRLWASFEVEPETENALVPTFLLQPLVENAMRYGIEPKSGLALLTIRVRKEDSLLRIFVCDRGPGIPDNITPSSGIGLSNTRARLRELYQDGAWLKLDSSGQGLTVEVTLPFHTVP